MCADAETARDFFKKLHFRDTISENSLRWKSSKSRCDFLGHDLVMFYEKHEAEDDEDCRINNQSKDNINHPAHSSFTFFHLLKINQDTQKCKLLMT